MSQNSDYDVCIICGEKSPYTIYTHIDYRFGYVEGAGQGCFRPNHPDCFENENEKQKKIIRSEKIKKILNKQND